MMVCKVVQTLKTPVRSDNVLPHVGNEQLTANAAQFKTNTGNLFSSGCFSLISGWP